ncbi:hypothetical protein [Actinoallomurus bryophytorum]|uniref:hypothetical protein n=1 Tax=Actinoallomurus bryophytorum TaxID=1490222 RepID=UPI0011525E9A|nr:hypothetical protein [Actinoallomurus bryophytorum]
MNTESSTRLNRVRWLGWIALSLWVLAMMLAAYFTCKTTVVLRAVAKESIFLPGLFLLFLLGLLLLAGHSMVTEWRAPRFMRPGTWNRVLGWLMVIAAIIAALPSLYVSAFIETIAGARLDCAPIIPGPRPPSCDSPTTAEEVAFGFWLGTAAITVVLIGACGVLAHRSRVAALAPIPVLVTGLVSALYLCRFTYFLMA